MSMDIGTLTGAIAIEDQFSDVFEKGLHYIGEFVEEYGKMGTAIVAGATIITGAVLGVAYSIEKLGEEGSTIQGVEDAFDRLATQAGSSGKRMADALTEGTRGTVDDMELMQTTMRMLSSGIKLTDDDLRVLGATAREMGKAAGTDATQELGKLSQAMLTGRTRALSQAGIIVDLDKAHRDFAKSLGITADQLSEAGKLEANRIAILQATKEHLDRLGESQLSFKERIQQADVAVDQWFDDLKKSVANSPQVLGALDAIGAAITDNFGDAGQTALETVVGLVNDFADGVATYGPQVIGFFRDTIDGVKNAYEWVQRTRRAIPDWLVEMSEDAVIAAGAIYGVRAALISLTEGQLLISIYNLAGVLDKIWQFATVTSVAQLTSLAGGIKNLIASIALTYQLGGVGAILQGVGAGFTLVSSSLLTLVGPTGVAAALVGLTYGLVQVAGAFRDLYKAWSDGRSMWDFFTTRHETAISRMVSDVTGGALGFRNADTAQRPVVGPIAPPQIFLPDGGPQLPDITKVDENSKKLKDYTDAAKEAEAAAKKYKEEIQALVQKTGTGDAFNTLMQLGTAWRQLTPAEQENSEVVKRVLDQYIKLRTETKVTDDALESLLATTGTLKSTSGAMAYELMKVPAAFHETAKQARENMNAAQGLTKDGLIPINDNTQDMIDLLDITAPKVATLTSATELWRGTLTQADVAAAHHTVTMEKLKERIGTIIDAVEDSARSWRHLADVTDSSVVRMIASGAEMAATIGKDFEQLMEAPDLFSKIVAGAKLAADAVGMLWDAFTKSPGEDVVGRVAHDLGVSITEELGNAIADNAKNMFGGSRAAAEVFNLDKIIEAAGGLKTSNFDALLHKLRDSFSMLETGIFSADQAAEVLDKNFKEFADHATKNGALVSRQFIEIIQLADQMGVSSQAINDYALGQTSTALSGLHALLQGTKELASQTAATGIASGLWAGFDELTKRGMSALDAIKQIAPEIDTLQKLLDDAGFVGGAAFDGIRAMAALATDEVAGPAIDAIHGAADALTGLHNVGQLNQEIFAGLSDQITATFENLVQQGKDGAAALALIAPDLQKVWELQQEFGYSVDDTTQQLLDQAKEAGLVGEAHKSAQEKAVDAMNAAADAMVRVGDILTQVFDTAGDNAERFARRATNAVMSIPGAPETSDAIPMAGGGDFLVSGPTKFLVGEAGVERARFSGAGKTSFDDTSGLEKKFDEFGRTLMRGLPRAITRSLESIILQQP